MFCITFFAKSVDIHKLGSEAIFQVLQGASQPYAPWDTVSSFIFTLPQFDQTLTIKCAHKLQVW